MALSGKQRRYLRSLGHHLRAVVQVGEAGVTEGVVSATAQALKDHELVKVRIADDRDGREAAIEALAQQTGAEVAQVLGRTALLFKRNAKKPQIRFDGEVLPSAEEEGKKPKPRKKTKRVPRRSAADRR